MRTPLPPARPPVDEDPAGLQPHLAARVGEMLASRRLGGARSRGARRILALALLLTAGGLALAATPQSTGGTPVVVTARDLPVGATLQPADLRSSRATAIPEGAISPGSDAASELRGSVLAGPVRRGEILTDVRLLSDRGPDPGPGRVAVAVRLADDSVAGLLRPGMRIALVRVVSPDPFAEPAGPGTDAAARATVLSEDAVVLAAVADPGDALVSSRTIGTSVLVSVSTADADDVTAALGAEIVVRFQS